MIDAAAAPFAFLCALLLVPVVLLLELVLTGLETLPLLLLGFSALALGFAFDGGGGRDGGTGVPTAVDVKGLGDGLLVPRPPPPAWHTLFWTWYFIPSAVIFFPQ